MPLNMPADPGDLLSDEMVVVLNNIIVTEAKIAQIKPIAEKLFQEAIDLYKPAEMINASHDPKGPPVTNRLDLFRTDDATFRKVYDYVIAGLKDEGFTAEVDFSPLSVEENNLIKGHRKMVELMKPFTGFGAHELICGGFQYYEKFVHETKKMLIPLLKTKMH